MKKTLSLGYVSLLFTVGGHLLVLPLAYRYLSVSQLALWFNYITLYSLILLLDFGITSTMARSFSQAWGSKVTDLETGHLRPDYERFASIYRASQAIYSKVALAGLAFALVAATPYLLLIGEQASDYRDVLYSWPIYCAALYLSLRQLYLVPALRGMDKIERIYIANIVSKFMQVGVTLLLLMVGTGIIAVSVGFLLSTLISRLLLRNFFRREIGEIGNALDWHGQHADDKEIQKSMAPKVLKHGMNSLAIFFQDKAALFYVSAFCGLETTSRYGLTMQIIGLIAAISNVYYNSVYSKMIEGHVQDDVDAIRKHLRNAASVQIGMIAAGGIGLYFFGSWVLNIAGVSNVIIDDQGLVLMVVYVAIFNFQLICASYLHIRDDYSMLWPNIISSVAFIVLTSAAAAAFNINYITVILIQLTVLLAYNAWKWPVKTRQILQIHVREV
jgi:O-antigen/teichoic acid export membrane protein